MKILMTANGTGSGWVYALELARALAYFDGEVALATLGGSLSDNQREEASQFPNLTLFESSYNLCGIEHPWDEIGTAGEWLLDLATNLRPSVVHLNEYTALHLPWPAPVLVVGHACVLSWWQAVRETAAPDVWNHYRQHVTAGLQAANIVVAPTRAMRTDLEQLYGPLPHACVIPHGRNPAQYTPSQKEPLVFAVGQVWDEAKNVGALARIAPRLSWPVYLAGDERPPLRDIRKSFPGVSLLGYLSAASLAPWFAKASIYAFPARYEPFGLSVLEAALAGCALVLGNIPSLREVWGNAALFVPPDDPDALEHTIQRLIADNKLREQYGRRARCQAFHYTHTRMAAAYWKLYTQLVLGQQPAAMPKDGRRVA